MSFEDFAVIAACSVPLAVIIALLPRSRRGERLEWPIAQPLDFDPLPVEGDGPILDLEPA